MYYRPGIGCVYLERDDKDGGLDTHPLHKNTRANRQMGWDAWNLYASLPSSSHSIFRLLALLVTDFVILVACF